MLFFFLQKYVQDMLKDEGFDVCEKLLSQSAHFYVCGDVKMADDVCRTLQVNNGGNPKRFAKIITINIICVTDHLL